MAKARSNRPFLIGTVLGVTTLFFLYDRSQRISRSFTLTDLTRSAKADQYGITEQFKRPPARIVHQARQFSRTVLQPIHDELGASLVVSGWYRHPLLNQLLGGSSNSGHLQAQAVDIQVHINGTQHNNEIIRAVVASGVPFSKMISELGTFQNPDYIHIRYTPGDNKQIMLRRDSQGYHTLTSWEKQQLGI